MITLMSPGAGSRMSVTITRTAGVIVLTLTSDPHSVLPPLCQILKGLCCSPAYFSVSQHLRRDQGTSQSLLGAVQIMVGLLTIGLGAILFQRPDSPRIYCSYTTNHYWLGLLFILTGAICILSEKRPSPRLVILCVILNIAGVGFALTAIVHFIINVTLLRVPSICDSYYDSSQTPEEDGKCSEALVLAFMLLKSINVLLIVLSLLELCAVMASFISGIETLKGSKDNKSPVDSELYNP
ncbi:membrane-spanning 4-domains subfamily A member 6C-like [Halichoeres trimaculatus]|uniref:membrane-spanning 4-domains subfamily A member 6C-like n=1 Tax=Halichoeres trimaculatus TaxID=147232 RepID=UPI003D9E1BB1